MWVRLCAYAGAKSGRGLEDALQQAKAEVHSTCACRILSELPECVRRRGPDQAEGLAIHYNKQRQKYTVPFIMAPINTRVVRRSNALLHHSYGGYHAFDMPVLLWGT